MKAIRPNRAKSEQPRDLGRKVEKLGKALQNPKTDLRKLVGLALDCGLKLTVTIRDP